MVDWTFNPVEIDWMVDHLRNFWDERLASFSATGFPAYGRLLHPAHTSSGTPIRWAAVAAHNEVPMRSTLHFAHVALPERQPVSGAWMGQAPEERLEREDAERLVAALASYTDPESIVSFALWDGLDWERPSRPDPIPAEVRQGHRMHLPSRNYIVYRGALNDALVWMRLQQNPIFWWLGEYTPHFWWPQDHAWVVASDPMLPWTTIAGPQTLIDHLVQDPSLEVVSITNQDVLDPQPSWVTELIDQAVHVLVEHGQTSIVTGRGAVQFCISPDRVWLTSESEDHSRKSKARLESESSSGAWEDQLFQEVSNHLLTGVGLAGYHW